MLPGAPLLDSCCNVRFVICMCSHLTILERRGGLVGSLSNTSRNGPPRRPTVLLCDLYVMCLDVSLLIYGSIPSPQLEEVHGVFHRAQILLLTHHASVFAQSFSLTHHTSSRATRARCRSCRTPLSQYNPNILQ